MVAAGTIIGGTALARSADADQPLPARSAEQLLVDLQTAERTPLSGTITDTVDLGLPELPDDLTGGADSASAAGLLTGEYTWRVWTDGADSSRLSLLGQAAETNIVRTGDDVWIWSSESQTATHKRIDPQAHEGAEQSDQTVPRTPQEAAQWALQRLDPSTQVTSEGAATVAGRAAYELVLTPRDQATRVKQVRLAIDAEKKVPLRVQVLSTKTSAVALRVGFSSVSFDTPPAGTFEFTPPPGATVVQAPEHTADQDPAKTDPATRPATDQPVTTGTGWATVLAGRVPDQAVGDHPMVREESTGPDDASSAQSGQELLALLPTASGAWGTGRVLDGTLFSAVITDDGRYAVGAVAPEALYAALPPQ